MKYLSIDIETTGLDPEKHQILSFGAILEDTNNPLPFDKIPKLYLTFNDRLNGYADFHALAMNAELLKDIAKGGDNCIPISELSTKICTFLMDNAINIETEKINLAGKNLAIFDLRFLEKASWRMGTSDNGIYNYPPIEMFNYRRRIIDPSALFMDWTKDDVLPNLQTCKDRAGISGEVSHNALQDAWDVIQILRTKY